MQAQLGALNNSGGTKQDELESEITGATAGVEIERGEQSADQSILRALSGSPGSGPKLLRDYDSFQALAKGFGGRSFNLDDANDRETFKVYLLSSLRPPGLKVIEEIARRYHDKFARPLPVSSLIRPEQYQRALRRVNRYAVMIDTPPHSTGLAFDINYRYMSITEQNFLMNELAHMKNEGRIEVLRERGANYHVFAFIDGQRPSDDLINASLDEAGTPVKQANHAEQAQSQQTSARGETKSRAAKNTRPNSKAKRTRSKAKAKRHR